MPLIPLFLSSSGVSLTIQGGESVSQGDDVVLTQVHLLIIQDGLSETQADNVVLTQLHILIVQDGNSPSWGDNVVLTTLVVLVIQDGYSGDVVAFITSKLITVDGKIAVQASGINYIKV